MTKLCHVCGEFYMYPCKRKPHLELDISLTKEKLVNLNYKIKELEDKLEELELESLNE